MKNQAIAEAFNKIADLLEIKGENPFRVRAYRRAAQVLETLNTPVETMTDEELLSLPGIGRDLLGKIREYVRDGRIEALERLKGEMPEGLAELLEIPGLGPKTVRLIYENLGITNVDQLERAARDGRLQRLPNIRKKTEENILKGIDILKRGRARRPIGVVLPIAEYILERIAQVKGVKRYSLAGSLRRWKETVKDVDILVSAEHPDRVMNALVKLPIVERVLLRGPTKTSVLLKERIQVDLRAVDDSSFGAALQYFTGSKEHNIKLREMALRKGLKINEYGVFNSEGRRLGGATEEEIYEILGLQYIPPELREGLGEVEAALQGSLPMLIKPEDIKGDLHIHSLHSDGRHSLEDIVAEARRHGYQYIAITDHSEGLAVAGGLGEERIMEQIREIDTFNSKIKGFRVFKGIEVNIRNDGSLDLPERVLSRLDFVVASIHSGFRQSSTQLTARAVSAMKSPHVDVIAHPTGRLLGERDPYEINLDEVIRNAVETDTLLEINAFPLRLDLNDLNVRKAKDKGARFVINTDAHFKEQMAFMRYGVAVARRGWLQKEDVINTLSLSEFQKWLSSKKRRV
jgi:DNA polymerase (family 10)